MVGSRSEDVSQANGRRTCSFVGNEMQVCAVFFLHNQTNKNNGESKEVKMYHEAGMVVGGKEGKKERRKMLVCQ